MLTIFIGIAMGACLSAQTAINSGLRRFVGSPFLASLVSFSVGTLTLSLFCLATGQGLWLADDVWAQAPSWVWIGGFLGVVVLTTNILLFPYLGGVQTAIMPILGQVFMGMLIDHFGWFYSIPQTFGLNRFVGALLVLIGIFMAVALPEKLAGKRPLFSAQRSTQSSSQIIWLWRLLGIVAGMLSAVQTAINGQLGGYLHSALQAALVSFAVGAFTLLLFVSLKERHFSALCLPIKQGMPCWNWLGGCLGAFFIYGGVMLVPLIGTGLTVIFTLLGMMIGSLCIDQFGLLNSPKKPIHILQIVGLLVLLSGVAMIRLI